MTTSSPNVARESQRPGAHALTSAQPITTRASVLQRARTMARVGVRMMFFDKLKLLGTMLGVVFAVVLSNQQLGTFLGLIYKNQMLVEKTGADLWILPAGAETLAAGKTVPMTDAFQARTTKGVETAEAMLLGAGTVKLPAGGTEAMTIVGVQGPRYSGAPWDALKGDKSAFNRPDTMFFEEADREVFGGVNVGSVREIAGRNITCGGLTWGLIPFGPSYGIADYELARELLKAPNDQTNYVAIYTTPGTDPKAVKVLLQPKVGQSQVVTKAEFKALIVHNILTKTAIGITFGTSTVFGLIVGFVIVSLSMFSAVVDNIREFGTLKAVGATNVDLALILLVQSTIFGALGSLLGLGLVTMMAKGIRSPKLSLVMPPWLTFGTFGLMILMCCFASGLALLRLRKVEPAMVFR
jgi:putative ABC transport system permease protein